MSEHYNAENIQVLKGLQAVRVRPSMYVGDTGSKGLHHLSKEILDNSVDEAMAGHCDEITVIIEKDGETISIEDNGRGIPVDLHKGEGKSSLEVVLTMLHAGGKFDNSGYEASGGLHGVGASCVNALSDTLEAIVWRDGGVWTQSYQRGVPVADVKRIGDSKKHGTKITWHADNQIFKDSIKIDESVLLKRFREVSFLNKGLTINFENKATGTKEVIVANGGIADYVKYLTEHRTGQYPAEPLFVETKTKLETREGVVMVQVALNYSTEDDETILSFANNINTVDGGTHTSGFKTALTRVVNQFAKNMELLKEKDGNLTGDDVREGLTAIISVRLPQPEFVGQTKAKLGTVEIEGIVSVTVTEMLTKFFDANAATIKKIVERAKIAQEARDAAKRQSALIKRKSFLGNSTRLPGKLSDCNSSRADICELFIVEGASAGGSGKNGRDPETQAILPIRGKIINAEKHDSSSLLKNQEIVSIILALGTGFKDEFDIDKLRYEKIIIMADADDDGCHIATLLITFFYRFMRQLVLDGHVYLAQPPLFRVDNGKDRIIDGLPNPKYILYRYCFNEKEMQDESAKHSDAKIIRFKGLGEMDADELGETTMKKGNRKLIQLKVPDLGDAERIISVLMGSNVQVRKDHIAKQVNSIIL